MKTTFILATTGKSIARAEKNGSGEWFVSAPLPEVDVRCLAGDPLDQRKVYAGTQGDGVLCSNDFGGTWQPAGLSGHVVKSLAVSPHEAGTIFAGVKPAGMHVSRDGGQTWSRHHKRALRDNHWLTFHHTNGDWVYQAGGTGGGASYSQDAGKTWQSRNWHRGDRQSRSAAARCDPDGYPDAGCQRHPGHPPDCW